MKNKKTFFLFVIFILLLSNILFSFGLSVTPATIVIQDVEIGKVYDLEAEKVLRIKIQNNAEMGFRYVVNANIPSESGTQATGYFDFIEPEWCWFDKETLDIEAGGEGYIRLYFEIPKDVSFYNRHWLLGITVDPITTLSGNPTTVALAAYLLYRIETVSNTNIEKVNLYDQMITLPSSVIFDNVVNGKKYIREINIKNTGKNRVNIYRLDPESSVAQLTILTSPGFRRLNNQEWLNYDKEVSLNDEGDGKFQLSLNIPEETKLNIAYEELIILERITDQKKAFIRVKIIPKKGGYDAEN